MFSRIRATYAEIRLSSLTHNFQALRGLLEDSRFICPMIKANAYGHGDIECARALSAVGAHDFGVVLIEEGIRLRQAGITGGILVFGTFHREASAEAIKYNLTPVISRWEDLRELEDQVPAGTNFGVHLKFNTGMNRMGFPVDEAPRLAETLSKSKRLELSGICTHLLNGEDAGLQEGFTSRQLTIFEELSAIFGGKKIIHHALNSSALCSKAFVGLGARPGIALYGSKPPLCSPSVINLEPVMTIKSKIEHLQFVKKDEVVSYGGTWRALQNTCIGVVPIGYADGYPRAASNKTFMLFRGKRVPVRGIVCMDYTMLDLGGFENPRVGEEVIVVGQQGLSSYTVDDLAKACNMISYEILTGVSSRVPRLYLHEGA